MRSTLLLCMLLTLLPRATSAQLAGFGGAIGEADLLYFADRPRESLELLERHLTDHPNDAEALWRAARAGVVLGIGEETVVDQNHWLDRAIVHGDRAVAIRPAGLDGLYWRGAAEGRRAMNAGSGYAAELAQRVYDGAHLILGHDPHHGGAHNLLGKLSYEIMSMSRLERLIARFLVGNEALRQSSWEDAEYHLETAAESWPDLVLFQFDLAQLYRKRGREEDARSALHRVTRMPPLHPPDAAFKKDARRFLEEMEGS